jgi:2-keto-4-pentenoate hydratase/2-oxohepta-3-ene-1,7-dioic acid hydratase in catechol pathway
MRIARLQTAAGIRYAVLQNDGWQHIDNPFDEVWSFTGETTPVKGAKLLAPVDPSVIVGIGHNDRDHPLPIQAWYKAVQTLANPGDEIRARQGAGPVNVEGELAVIIGKSATGLTSDNATEHVLGYTIANDVTNAGLLHIDERLFQAKAGANYTPLGPWIETEIEDPESVTILVTINGQVKARSGSFNLPSSIVDCLIYVTKWVTLEPGDVVMTGAPGTSVAVDPGDRVEITLGGIGTLANSVT